MSMDNREKLEADALKLVDDLRVYGFNYTGDAEVEIIGMLDRQASITRAELERNMLDSALDELAGNHIGFE